MFILLLIYHFTQGGVDAFPIPPGDLSTRSLNFANTSPFCTDIRHCRQLSSIITSCFTTILACIWVVQHPDVPSPEQNKFRTFALSLLAAFVALEVPELLLYRSLWQFIVAGQITEELNKLELEAIAAKGKAAMQDAAKKAVTMKENMLKVGSTTTIVTTSTVEVDRVAIDTNTQPTKPQMEGAVAKGEGAGAVTVRRSSTATVAHAVDVDPSISGDWISVAESSFDPNPNPTKYTRTHGFFILMGGFHLYKGQKPSRRLQKTEVLKLFKKGLLSMPEKDRIQDRSKRTWISKGLVLIQTIWFVIQCCARLAQHLSITEFELTTLAYTIITVGTSYFWFQKPLNVGVPERVTDRSGVTDPPERPLRYIIQWDGGYHGWHILAAMAGLVVGIVFGALHCLSWWWSYSYWHDRAAWFKCSLTISILPVGMAIILALLVFIIALKSRYNDRPNVCKFLHVMWYILLAISQAGFWTYELARYVLLYLSLDAFNHPLNPSAYKTVDWAIYIPHI